MPTTYEQSEIDAALAAIKFDAQGLVPAIAQQHDTGASADDGLDGPRRRG